MVEIKRRYLHVIEIFKVSPIHRAYEISKFGKVTETYPNEWCLSVHNDSSNEICSHVADHSHCLNYLTLSRWWIECHWALPQKHTIHNPYVGDGKLE